jgi:hypothetical protein
MDELEELLVDFGFMEHDDEAIIGKSRRAVAV